MDAVEYLETKKQMCKEMSSCLECPYGEIVGVSGCDAVSNLKAETIISIVENWKNRKVKTRQSEFLKLFSNAPVKDDGIVDIRPCMVDSNIYNSMFCKVYSCSKCCSDYWSTEVE